MTRALLDLKPTLRLDLRDGAYLRPLHAEDVTSAYVHGLNDPQVNRYLEVRRQRQTADSVRIYVRDNASDTQAILFGVFQNSALRGTIRLHDVDFRHGCATIGIALFDRGVWGQGLGTAALEAVVSFAFKELRLSRLMAGIVEVNIGSIRTFEKVGFQRNGAKDPDPDLGPAKWWVLEARPTR